MAILERERYGMNIDPAYVQSLLNDDRTFTEHERRWIKSFQRVEFESAVDDYVQHWREDWGGTSVIARYPDRPYLLVRLLRRVGFHSQRIKRLSKYDVRIVRSSDPARLLLRAAAAHRRRREALGRLPRRLRALRLLRRGRRR